MQPSKSRLWKQIGCQALNKQNTDKNNPNSQNFAAYKQIKQNQQFYEPLLELQSSFQKLQLSQIVHKDLNDAVASFINKPKGYNVFNDLENMLSDFCQNNKDMKISNNTNSSYYAKNQGQKKEKYFQACKLFKNILKNLRQNLQFLQRSALKQIQKSKQFKNKVENQFKTFQKSIKKLMQNMQKQVIHLSTKCEQLQKNLLQKSKIQKELKIQMEKMQSIKQIRQKQFKIKQQEYNKQIHDLKKQNYNILKLNSDLSQKIFDLEQKMQGFDLQVQKKAENIIKQSIHIFKDDGIKKVEQLSDFHQFTQKGAPISPICQVKFDKNSILNNQQNQMNYFRSTQINRAKIKVQSKSGAQSMIDDMDRRKTFSHFYQNIKKNVQNPQICQNQYQGFQEQILLQKQSICTVSGNKLKRLLLQPKSISQNQKNKNRNPINGEIGKKQSLTNKTDRFGNQTWISKVRSRQKQQPISYFSGTQSYYDQQSRKSSNVDDLILRLNRMKVQIQSDLKNLKSSISTNV